MKSCSEMVTDFYRSDFERLGYDAVQTVEALTCT